MENHKWQEPSESVREQRTALQKSNQQQQQPKYITGLKKRLSE